MKVGKILGYMKFSIADGPRVRGGRSAIHEVFHQRLWSSENCSADSPPMDRGRSARCTGKLRLHRWCVHYASADGPPSIPRTVRLRQVESAQKSDKYWINLESLKLKGPQVDHLYKWLRNLGLVLKWSRSMTSIGYKAIWLRSIFGTLLVLKLRIKTNLK